MQLRSSLSDPEYSSRLRPKTKGSNTVYVPEGDVCLWPSLHSTFNMPPQLAAKDSVVHIKTVSDVIYIRMLMRLQAKSPT